MESLNYCYFTINKMPVKGELISQKACYARLFEETDSLLNGNHKFNICYAIITLNKNDLLTEQDKINWINYLKRKFGGIVNINKQLINIYKDYYKESKQFTNCLIIKIDPYTIKNITTEGNRYLIYKLILTFLRYLYETDYPKMLNLLLINYNKRNILLQKFSKLELLINLHRVYYIINDFDINSNHSIVHACYIPKFRNNYLKLNINKLITNQYSTYGSRNRPHINMSIEAASKYIDNEKIIKALDNFYKKFEI